jgi:glyoxylase-like metal-dependent hydrolase (beta-lactamase superfamily II)
VIFKQFRFERLGQASYLFGCPRAKEAFVVDPTADLGVEFYVLEAADFGLAVVQVLETHVHADFISCARELAETVGAEHRLFHTAPVRYAFAPLVERQTLDAGRARASDAGPHAGARQLSRDGSVAERGALARSDG